MQDTDEIDIYELLARDRKIAAIWSIEDVQHVRPDLTDDQAWEVLQHVDNIKDAECGITWSTLETVADDLFPEPTDELEKRHS